MLQMLFYRQSHDSCFTHKILFYRRETEPPTRGEGRGGALEGMHPPLGAQGQKVSFQSPSSDFRPPDPGITTLSELAFLG